ncbi:MAG: ATPase domain-containing protein [Candidatus Bathyarchaeia archaeon]
MNEDVVIDRRLLKYVDVRRLMDSLHYRIENFTVAGGKVYASVVSVTESSEANRRGQTGQGRTLSPSVDVETGKFFCSCEDYTFRKTLCKHVLALLRQMKKSDPDTFSRFIASLDGEGKPSMLETYVKTDVESLDRVILGVPKGAVFGIVGEPKVGKTFLSYQIAVNAVRGGCRALFVNTETDFPTEEIFNKYREIYGRRYQLDDVAVDVVNISSLVDLCKFFGLEVEFVEKGMKLDTSIHAISFDTSEVYNVILNMGYNIVVVDSLTAPVKQAVPVPPNQNLPARATVINTLWGRFALTAEKFRIPVVVTHHVSKDPQSYSYGEPFGGDSVLYNMKFVVYVLNGAGAEKDAWKDEARRFMIYRYPGIPRRVIVPARLKKDFGFVSEPLPSKKGAAEDSLQEDLEETVTV